MSETPQPPAGNFSVESTWQATPVESPPQQQRPAPSVAAKGSNLADVPAGILGLATLLVFTVRWVPELGQLSVFEWLVDQLGWLVSPSLVRLDVPGAGTWHDLLAALALLAAALLLHADRTAVTASFPVVALLTVLLLAGATSTVWVALTEGMLEESAVAVLLSAVVAYAAVSTAYRTVSQGSTERRTPPSIAPLVLFGLTFVPAVALGRAVAGETMTAIARRFADDPDLTLGTSVSWWLWLLGMVVGLGVWGVFGLLSGAKKRATYLLAIAAAVALTVGPLGNKVEHEVGDLASDLGFHHRGAAAGQLVVSGS